MHDPHNDPELFRRIAAGDEQAFAIFFEAYAVRLARYVARFLNSELWAEEIVQDVFLKLWETRATIGEIEHPAAFVYRMVANRAKNHIARHAREVRLQYYLSTYPQQQQAEDALDFRTGERLFKEALSQLPPQRAAIFKMRYERGMGYEEIARELGLSRNTVRNHLNLALQNIRSYLLEHGDIAGYIALFFTLIGT